MSWVRVCRSFEEEAEADREYWSRVSPDERVAMIHEMRRDWARRSEELMLQPTKDDIEFLACLVRHDVRALIVGAHAIAFHAKPRYTRDLDVFVEPSPENAERVLKALDEFGFGSLAITRDDLAVEGRVVQLGVEPNRIDLLTRIDGLSFADAWQNRVAGTIGGVAVYFIARQDLIRNKEASARPQDLADVDLLRRMS
ncbi:MAG TPA: DUF6036 family nucleotidyltransferase [Thermoanaerobaculia bacterium]